MLDPATPCSWQAGGRHTAGRKAIGTTLARHLNRLWINFEAERAYRLAG